VTAATLLSPLTAVLRQIEGLIESMTDAQYGTSPVGAVTGGVGGHVRHCLDHVEALLTAVETGDLDYDRRERGTPVETCRVAALAAIRSLSRRLLDVPAYSGEWPIRLTFLAGRDARVTVETTVGRELAFVLSHTIHHNALIAVMARTLGVPVPHRFGYAPSTPTPEAACVR
jgi:uncharacterized damage-inducible protein DinB